MPHKENIINKATSPHFIFFLSCSKLESFSFPSDLCQIKLTKPHKNITTAPLVKSITKLAIIFLLKFDNICPIPEKSKADSAEAFIIKIKEILKARKIFLNFIKLFILYKNYNIKIITTFNLNIFWLYYSALVVLVSSEEVADFELSKLLDTSFKVLNSVLAISPAAATKIVPFNTILENFFASSKDLALP